MSRAKEGVDSMKFMKGERVRAKWPGSNKYFLGTVLDVLDNKCEVKFDEGTSYSVLLKNVFREAPASPSRKSANSIPDRSPSRKSSVERSSRKSSTERTTRKSSMERIIRKSSAERTVRKSSTERSARKSLAEQQPVKPANRSPSRTAGRPLSKSSQELQSRPGSETPVPRSPGRPKSARLSRAPAVVSLDANSRPSPDNLPSLESSFNESVGEGDNQFVDSYAQFKDRAKELVAKGGRVQTEFSSIKTSTLTSQVSARRALRGTSTPTSAISTPFLPSLATATTAVPTLSMSFSPSLATATTAVPTVLKPYSSSLATATTAAPTVSTPASLGLVQRSLLVNGSFSDDEEGDLSSEAERVVTSSVVKRVVEEETITRRPSVEPPAVPSAIDLLHSMRESSVLRNSVPLEDRPRQWSLDPTARSSASLRSSVRRSIVREVDSNSVHGGSVSGRDYAEGLKREGRMLAFVPPDYMEWGGAVGCALWTLLLPVALVALHLHCDQVSCNVGVRELNMPLKWNAYLDMTAVLAVLGFVGVQATLCVLPVGYQVDLIPNIWGSPKYRCNGLLSAAVSLAVVCAVKYLGYSIAAITSRYLQLLVASLLFSVVLSIALYWRGAQIKLHSINPYVRNRGFLYTFWAGREVYPQFWHLHVKTLLSKISLVGSLVLSLVLLLEEVEWDQGWHSHALLLCTAMLGLYLLDSLWFEEGALTSFSMQYEGCGYMTTMLSCSYPFLATLPLRHHLLHRSELSDYALFVLFIIFMVGFCLYRLSNSQKDKFRRNPLDPSIAHLETIPTSLPRSRKLLASSYWGFVRHPNYLGDIIMHLALAGTCGLSLALPYALSLCVVGVLLHRASRDGARCAHRYGSDWKRYCGEVEYKVIPYVY